ncbi:MAG: WG repeat-containing protein [Clostridia bacterium]|nr:WG repeat-containing protein [Clostridia bacterium]
MKHIFARCLLMLMCLAMSSGTLAEGYVWVIPPQFDDVLAFSDGLAGVWVGDWDTGKCGFIDKTGKLVVPCTYDDSGPFSEGLARVMVSDGETEKWGFIDKMGKEVVPPQYDWAEDFCDGLAMVFVGDGQWGDWDIVEGGKWGFIDKTGKEVVPVEYDKVGEFHEGRASVIKDGKLGFVDGNGTVVIPLTYDIDWPPQAAWYLDVMPFFSEGLVAIWAGDIISGPYGYIDRDGHVVIPFDYDYAAPFSEGLAYVSKGGFLETYESPLKGKYGFIDKAGEVVVPLVYDCGYRYWGIIFERQFVDGFATVSKGVFGEDMQYGMMDKTGTVILPIEYDWVYHLNDGLALAGFGSDYGDCCFGWEWWKSCGLVDKTGKEVVPFGTYDNIATFKEGLAKVSRGFSRDKYGMAEYGTGTYGFIDTTGKEVVPCIFEDARSFSEGLAAVLVDEKWGYIAIVK